MRSVLDEDSMTLAEATKVFPAGRKLHVNTLRRWAQDGYRGIRLRTFRCGQRICTTREAINEFLAAINGEDAPSLATPAHQAAEAELDALGV
jgi:hypothetical protein